MYTAAVLITGCKFFPDQLLVSELPGADRGDAGAATTQRGTTTSATRSEPQAGSAASQPGRSAMSNTPNTPNTSTMSSKAAAPSGGASSVRADAGVQGTDGASGTPTRAGMTATTTNMGSAGSKAEPAAGSGASNAGAGSTKQPAGAQDPSCDFSGVWISKQVAVTLALDEPQFMNNWAYYEIEQSGADFVVKKHLDCGAEVLGSGSVTISRATLAVLVQHNMQNGRKGHFSLTDGKCALDIANFWSVRGAEEERFLPNPTRDSTMTMAELMKMKPLPTPRMPDGAVDSEMDGQLGVAGQINGIVSGVRNSCQRDWDHWFTAPGYEITPSMDFADDLKIRIEYETEESVMAPTSGLLTTPTDNTNDWDHIMYFRFLGRTAEDSRAQAIVHADAVETCYAIQEAMPAEKLKR